MGEPGPLPQPVTPAIKQTQIKVLMAFSAAAFRLIRIFQTIGSGSRGTDKAWLFARVNARWESVDFRQNPNRSLKRTPHQYR